MKPELLLAIAIGNTGKPRSGEYVEPMRPGRGSLRIPQ